MWASPSVAAVRSCSAPNIIAAVEYIHVDLDGVRAGGVLIPEWEQDIDLVRARLSMMLNACCEGQATSKTGLAAAAAPTGWGGFYFGSNAAIGWADADLTLIETTAVLENRQSTFTDSLDDMDGYLAGVHLGGNVQHGALVLGGEISVSAGEIDGSKSPNCFADQGLFLTDPSSSARRRTNGCCSPWAGWATRRALGWPM